LIASSRQRPFPLPFRPRLPLRGPRCENFHLVGNRGLAKSWRDRAQGNLAAIRLAAEIEAEHRPATAAFPPEAP
jgi:hypothetical protein